MATYEERIREVRGGLSPSFVRLADYLLDSYAEASFLTATELAHTLDLDPATVVRFAQRLGYPGYPELQREIRQKVKDQLLARPQAEPGTAEAACDAALLEVSQALDLTRRGFPSQAAQGLLNALDGAKRIVVLAEGLAYSPARTLAAWLEVGRVRHRHRRQRRAGDGTRGGRRPQGRPSVDGDRRRTDAVHRPGDGRSPRLGRPHRGARRLTLRPGRPACRPAAHGARQPGTCGGNHPHPGARRTAWCACSCTPAPACSGLFRSA